MYSCQDLTPNEHDGLQALSYRRNRRTGAVAVNGTPLAVLDALAEMGFLRRQEEGGVLVILPCPGHAHEIGVDLGICAPGARRSIPAQPVTELEPGLCPVNRLPVTRGRLSIKTLIDKFATQCRLYCWSSTLTNQGRYALIRSWKSWVADGATLEEIDWMIDRFFADLNGQKQRQQHKNLWKMFLARKRSLADRNERQRTNDEMEAHRYDPEYWQ